MKSTAPESCRSRRGRTDARQRGEKRLKATAQNQSWALDAAPIAAGGLRRGRNDRQGCLAAEPRRMTPALADAQEYGAPRATRSSRVSPRSRPTRRGTVGLDPGRAPTCGDLRSDSRFSRIRGGDCSGTVEEDRDGDNGTSGQPATASDPRQLDARALRWGPRFDSTGACWPSSRGDQAWDSCGLLVVSRDNAKVIGKKRRAV